MATITIQQALQTAATLSQAGQLDESAAIYRQILVEQPNSLAALVNLANLLCDLRRFDEAIALCQRALALSPNVAEAHNNLGNALMGSGCYQEAKASFQSAIAINPHLAEAFSNLGLVYMKMGRFEEALHFFRTALARNSGFATAHWSLATLLLLMGRYEEGWKEHEWRLALPCPWMRFSEPRWDGRVVPDQRILLYPEQGHGDTIHFLRYVPLVTANTDSHSVLLICANPMVRLIEQSGLRGVQIIAREGWDGPALPPFDQHLPLLSLPLTLGVLNPPPMESAYLQPDPELCAAWRARLKPGASFRVGLTWAGSHVHTDDARRSICFDRLLPLLRVPGVDFYSLQVGPENGPPRVSAADTLIDLTNQITDFADTAAIIAELDLIISVDTAVAHLAGALARSVWTLLPYMPDWRWGLEREDTIWYPTMRLFRQPTTGDWDSVIRRVVEELTAIMHSPI